METQTTERRPKLRATPKAKAAVAKKTVTVKGGGMMAKALAESKPKIEKAVGQAIHKLILDGVEPAKAVKRATKPQGNGAKLQALLERTNGATMSEMEKATGWKPHSIRAYISAGLKKRGITVTSDKIEGKDRVYIIDQQEGV